MKTDADALLAARFAATRDDVDLSDWSDVLRRSRVKRAVHRRALLVVAALVVVLVPTTIAFGGTIRGFFFGTPAPPIIRQAFAEDSAGLQMMRKWQRAHGVYVPGSVALHVNVGKAHGVLAVNTHDGPLLLWAAPAGHGRQCWFIDFASDQVGHKRATGGGTCETAALPPSKIDWGYGWSAAHPTLKVLSGRLYVKAIALLVDTGTQRRRVPVVDSYFLAAFPRSTKMPTKLTAIDKQGHVVATFVR